MGDDLITWSARAAVACLLMRPVLALGRRGRVAGWSEITVWTAGWLCLVAHTAIAFQFEHHWSHAEAYRHTARRTAELTGWNSGSGLYLNYLTVALWGLDVWVLIRALRRQSAPPRWWTWLVGSWIGFITVNATVVFGPHWWWGVGALFLAAVAIARRSSQEIV